MTEKNHMSEILQFIKEYLQRGDVKKIAEEEFNMTAQNGYDILANRTKNAEFIEACYKKAFERASKFLAMKEQANILRQKIEQMQ